MKIVVILEVSSTAKSLEDFLKVEVVLENIRLMATIARIMTTTMIYLFFLII
jgi:hypothetical protein